MRLHLRIAAFVAALLIPALALAQGGSIANPRPLSCSVVAQACNVQIPPSGGALLTTTGDGSGLTNLSGAQLTAGSLSLAKIGPIGDKTILANITGGSASPAANSLTALLDNMLGSVQGSVIFRGASTWSVLTPGSSGLFLQTQGVGANPQWATLAGSGTVNSGTTGQLAYYAANGTAVSGTTALPSGTTATTQTAGDNSTKVATTAYVDAAMPTGVVMPYVGSAAPAGWLLMAGTIGDATSGATNRANADTINIYTLIWTAMADAQAPVSGGRGASAAADFAAHKAIALPDMRGRTAFGKDNMGGSAANRVTSGISGVAGTTLGAVGGDERMQSHNHLINDPGHTHGMLTRADLTNGGGAGAFASASSNLGQTTQTGGTGITIQNNGAGNSQNMPPTVILNYIIHMRRRPPSDDNRRSIVRHHRRRRAA
jgi:hypothetical protein